MKPILANAQFITTHNPDSPISPLFRKEFQIKKTIASANLVITANGVYEARINGKRVGDFILAPGFTSYPKRLQVQTYDVTEMLSNNSTLDIILGNGWRYGALQQVQHGIYEKLCDRSVIASLNITYNDGCEESIVTDEQWIYSDTGILYSDIYNGETYDANATLGPWENAVETEGLRDTLIMQEGETVREIESLKAVNLFVTPNGERVIDFGQEITGYVEFRCVGEKGDKIVIDHGEVLDRDGNFYNENYRSARSNITYITNGDSERWYHPTFTFQGFRYIRLTEYPVSDIDVNDFRAIVVHSNMKRTGWFTCSDPLVNKLYSNIIWSQRGNFLDIPTDCPQRDERVGWTGDAQVFCRTAAYNFDVKKFFKKWLHDLSADQSSSGAVSNIVPSVNGESRGVFGWGDAAIICPWELYVAYGDVSILREQYDSMQAWVNYVWAKGDTPDAWASGSQFGDWLGLDAKEGSLRGSTDINLLATAFLIHSADLVIKAGKVLEYSVGKYEAILEYAKKIFLERFVTESGMLTCDTQTAYAVTLAFCIAPDNKRYAKYLADKIHNNGDKLQTGFIGTAYIMEALTENGQAETAYTLLLQKEFPSWLYSVRMGATTIWEHWDGIKSDGSMWSHKMNSFNHYAYGSVASWLYRTVAGIRSDESKPGYENILISPIPDKRLNFASASLETAYGKVSSGCKRVEGGFEITVTIPDGATADICVGEIYEHKSGGTYVYMLKDL